MKIIEGRWKAEVVCGNYVTFLDLTTNKTTGFYDMTEIDRRKISAIIDKKDLNWIRVAIGQNGEHLELRNEESFAAKVW